MSFFLNPALACDYYKIGHLWMQPEDVSFVYSTWTARSSKFHPECPKTVVFGYQYTIRELVDYFNDHFFNERLDVLEEEWNDMIADSFNERYADFSKFRKLHELGYLPIKIMGVPEGTLLPTGMPDHVIFNTHSDFAWLPQYLEDLWSSNNWLPSTSATTAYYRYKMIEPYAKLTSNVPDLARHMCGDFSMRGHSTTNAAYISGAGHLLSFDRTATIGANALLIKYYDAMKIPGLGTPSLEHSVVEQGIADMKLRLSNGTLSPKYQKYVQKAMLQGNWEINLIAEMCFIIHLLTEVQPSGTITYVADTYDYWGVVGKVLPIIREVIMDRDGCFSVRPDSGNPVDIICGTAPISVSQKDYDQYTWEQLGTLRTLAYFFGGAENEKGYWVLPKQIRMIYGDAITADITRKVCQWCVETCFSLENLCFGIGAYTYQYVTRDTRGYAIKATAMRHGSYGEIPLYKQPKTDLRKKSPRGAVAIIKDPNGEYHLIENLTITDAECYPENIMVTKFEDGEMKNVEDFETIRARLNAEE